MQQIGVMGQAAVAPLQASLLRRFVVKVVVDVVPAALASLLVGCLLTQYQFGHVASSSAPAAPAAQADAASAEMVQLVRDEHAMIVDYLKTQADTQKSRYAAEDAASAQAAANAKLTAAATEAPRQVADAEAVAPPAANRVKSRAPSIGSAPQAVQPARTPLVLVQDEQFDGTAPVASAPLASTSLLARTVDIKNHVVHATLHMVSAIGGIPNWIAAVGDRIGGGNASGDARQLSASS
jgi:small-conductance mechanosensitive channel